MTAAIFAATIAFVLALCLGVVIGRRTRDRDRSRGFAFLDRIPRRSASTAAEFVSEATLGPREVPASAEVRDSDVQATTDDGRMTKAGLLSMVVRNTETAIAVVDEFRDVVLYNQRAVELGLVREMLLADPVWEAVKEVLDTGVERRFEFSPPMSSLGFVSTGRTPRPSVEHVRCHARIVAQGEERYVVAYGLDDTELKRVEATRRDFVANVSHELKTPVGAVALLAEALLDSLDGLEPADGGEPDPDAVCEVRRFGDKLLREATRMGNLVSELIALSRLTGAERLPALAAVDVDEVVSEALARSRTSAESHAVEITADETSGLVVDGDRTLLVTALTNLLENAIAYSAADSSVSVSRRSVDGSIEIAVTDRGIGIAPEHQQRVFERFFRVDPARSRATGGTGLGLAIVKHVCANHGGEVRLWSRPGTGSTFTMRLPARMGIGGAPHGEAAAGSSPQTAGTGG